MYLWRVPATLMSDITGSLRIETVINHGSTRAFAFDGRLTSNSSRTWDAVIDSNSSRIDQCYI